MEAENDLEKEEKLNRETEKTDADDCCSYVAVPCGCGCECCQSDVEEYCC